MVLFTLVIGGQEHLTLKLLVAGIDGTVESVVWRTLQVIPVFVNDRLLGASDWLPVSHPNGMLANQICPKYLYPWWRLRGDVIGKCRATTYQMQVGRDPAIGVTTH